jgi:hypothetical protein
MKQKVLIDARRRRSIPEHFTWVDHRLVSDGHIRKCSIKSLGFYLFLITVADCDGLSFYGERRISEELSCAEETVPSLRSELITAGLIAYRNGIYQVLDLRMQDREMASVQKSGTVYKVSDVLEKLLGGMRNG